MGREARWRGRAGQQDAATAAYAAYATWIITLTVRASGRLISGKSAMKGCIAAWLWRGGFLLPGDSLSGQISTTQLGSPHADNDLSLLDFFLFINRLQSSAGIAPASSRSVLPLGLRPRKTLIPAVVVTLFAFAVPSFRAAAVHEAWVQRYSNVVSNSSDRALKVVADANGDIIVAGTSSDTINGFHFLTIKYSGTDGSLLWQQRHNLSPGLDPVKCLAVDPSGRVVVIGNCRNEDGKGVSFMVKFAGADGSVISQHRYTNSAITVVVDPGGNVVIGRFSSIARYAAEDAALIWERSIIAPPNTVAVDGNGNVAVTGVYYPGTGADFYTAKYAAADGALLWERPYFGVPSRDEYSRALAMDADGNVVVTGRCNNLDGRTGSDYYTAKYAAADGALIWEKLYDGPSHDYDEAVAVVVDTGGNAIVTGTSPGANGSRDYYTAKHAATNGVLLWEKRYAGPSNGWDIASAVALDASGNVVVTGYSRDSGGNNDCYTAKYAAADGALLWEKRCDGPADSLVYPDYSQGLAVDIAGSVVVVPHSWGISSGFDYLTIKYAATNGALLWEQRYTGPGNSRDVATSAAVDTSGNVIVTGYSAGESGVSDSSDYYTAKYAATGGRVLWAKRYNGPANGADSARAVAVDAGDNVVVTGFSQNSGGVADYYTAKYAATDGALLWEKRYTGGPALDDYPQAIAVDAEGNVFVTGFSRTSRGDEDYYTAKYAAADGELLWEQRYDGPSQQDDRAWAVAVDANGNAVITGSSAGTNLYADFYTVKYAAANGAVLWEKRYNGPARRNDEARAVAVDGNNDVVVAGFSRNATNADYYTAKYSAVDGALVWERRYNGPADRDDVARAVAVDASGNVVVTGSSRNSSGNDDYYTAKYAGANGVLLWEKRYNGQGNSNDVAQAVAVDGRGNIVVTGSSVGTDLSADYYTAKYAESDGALIWEKSYQGPGAGDDQPQTWRSLAIGPGGVVVVTGGSDGSPSSAVNYDYATVKYVDSPSILHLPAGEGYLLEFPSEPGQPYALQRANVITGPWATLATGSVPPSGYVLHMDDHPLPSPGFYRLVFP